MSPPTLSSTMHHAPRCKKCEFFDDSVNADPPCTVLVFGRRGGKVRPSPTECELLLTRAIGLDEKSLHETSRRVDFSETWT